MAHGEDAVDVLELEPLRLRIEDEDDGDPDGVEDGEDDVGLPADVLDRGRRDLYDEEVTDPVAGGGDGGATLAQAEGEDLGSVCWGGGLGS
jgi:hypothetical protein